MSPFKHIRRLKPKPGKEIPFLILISFLFTFAFSRGVTYLFPQAILVPFRGVHVHHFAYGIILLAITTFILLIQPRSDKTRLRLSLIYGLGLGLAFDEFFMWIQLADDVYWNRRNFDAIIIVALIIGNVVYFEGFWRKWGNRLGRFFRLISEY